MTDNISGALHIPEVNETNNTSQIHNVERQALELHRRLGQRNRGNIVTGMRPRQGQDHYSSESSVAQSPSGTSYDTDNRIVDVINICNDIDTESSCKVTEQSVKQCIRQQIWVNNKFLTDDIMKKMAITDRTNPNTLINLLLSFLRRTGLSDAHRFRFWKKYGIVVQKELNNLKTNCTRLIKNQLMRGELTLFYLCYPYNKMY